MNKKNALVSIIIPTYNRAYVISETLKSVYSQTYPNWECIVVDDGSTDNTKNIVEEVSKTDPRFFYFKNIKSKGAPGARNTGLELARGEFISFFDSDDKLLPKYIENKLKHFIANPELDLVISSSKMVEKGKETFYTNMPTKQDPLVRFYSLYPIVDIPWLTPTLIRKSFLEKNNILWDETVKLHQDIQFNTNVLSKNPNYTWLKGEVDWYWVDYNSANNIGSQNQNEFDIIKKTIEFYWNNLKSATVDKRIRRMVETQYNAQLVFFSYKLSKLQLNNKEFLQYVKQNSNLNNVEFYFLKKRHQFISKLPIGMKERLLWKLVRIYFQYFLQPIIKEGYFLKQSNL